jgi:hypothetical protein
MFEAKRLGIEEEGELLGRDIIGRGRKVNWMGLRYYFPGSGLCNGETRYRNVGVHINCLPERDNESPLFSHSLKLTYKSKCKRP